MSLKNLNTRRLHADRAMPIRVFNTLSRKKEEFVPLHANRVSMFVCGLTPQDETHMGHAKTYVAFDVVARFLRHKGYHLDRKSTRLNSSHLVISYAVFC